MSAVNQSGAEPGGSGLETYAGFTAARARSAASLMQAGEIASGTATAIWRTQTDFLQHEAVESLKGFGAFSARKDPGAVVNIYLDNMRDGFERAIADARAINDLLLGGTWQMVSLYAGFWPAIMTPSKFQRDSAKPE